VVTIGPYDGFEDLPQTLYKQPFLFCILFENTFYSVSKTNICLGYLIWSLYYTVLQQTQVSSEPLEPSHTLPALL